MLTILRRIIVFFYDRKEKTDPCVLITGLSILCGGLFLLTEFDIETLWVRQIIFWTIMFSMPVAFGLIHLNNKGYMTKRRLEED